MMAETANLTSGVGVVKAGKIDRTGEIRMSKWKIKL
jgi:hypothetical protein